jgi:hypothetical protein
MMTQVSEIRMHTCCVRSLTIDAVVIDFVVCDLHFCDDGVMTDVAFASTSRRHTMDSTSRVSYTETVSHVL